MTDAIASLDELVSANRLEGFNDVFWNLGQIIAWVETRSPFPVDALSDSTRYLARREHSMPAGLPHFATEFAERRSEASGLARGPSPYPSIDDVRRAVLRSLQAGLPSSGQRRGSFDREPIPRLEWADLTIDDSMAGEMTVRHRHGAAAAWTDVRVLKHDVLSAFPVLATSPDAAPGDASAQASAPEAERTSPEAATRKPRGRRPGDGSYDRLDRPLLEEMKELIASGKAASAEEAAKLLAGKAHGGGTLESKIDRLAKRYRAVHASLAASKS